MEQVGEWMDRWGNGFGVPQGLILGTLLFIIYINDIENVMEKCEIVLYSDVTLIFTECKTCEECYDRIGKDMDNINKWLRISELKFNENKTMLMEIYMQSNSSFRINNVIKKVNSINYLGFLIDRDLKLRENLEYVEK